MLLLIHSADYWNTAQQRKRGGLRRDFELVLLVTFTLHGFTSACLGVISSQTSTGFGV